MTNEDKKLPEEGKTPKIARCYAKIVIEPNRGNKTLIKYGRTSKA